MHVAIGRSSKMSIRTDRPRFQDPRITVADVFRSFSPHEDTTADHRASRVKLLRSTRLIRSLEPRSVEVNEESGGRSLCACRPKSRAIGLDAGEQPRAHLS